MTISAPQVAFKALSEYLKKYQGTREWPYVVTPHWLNTKENRKLNRKLGLHLVNRGKKH